MTTEMQKNGADTQKLVPLPLELEDAIYQIISFKRVMIVENGACLAFPDSFIEVVWILIASSISFIAVETN